MAKEVKGGGGSLKVAAGNGSNGGSQNAKQSSSPQGPKQSSSAQTNKPGYSPMFRNQQPSSGKYNPVAIYGKDGANKLSFDQIIRDQSAMASAQAARNGRSHVPSILQPSVARRGDLLTEASAWGTMMTHLSSPTRDRAVTQQYLNEANEFAEANKNRPFHMNDTNAWLSMAEGMKAALFDDYQAEIEGLKKGKADRSTLRQAAQNRVRSTTSLATNLGGIDENGNLVEGDKNSQNASYWKNIIKGYDEQDAVDDAKISALEEEMFQTFMTPELEAAWLRKTENKYGYYNQTTATGERDPNTPDYWIGDFTSDSDQAMLDEYRLSLNLNPKFYNWADRNLDNLKRAGETIGSALAGVPGTIRKSNAGQEVLIDNRYDYNGDWVIDDEERARGEAEDRAKRAHKVGALNAPEISDVTELRKIAEDEPFSEEVDPAKYAAAKEAQAQLEAGAVSWAKNAESIQARIDEITRWEEEDFARAVDVANDQVTIDQLANEAAEKRAEKKRLEKELKEAREIANLYGGGRLSLSYAYKNGTNEDIASAYDQLSWELTKSAETRYAKEVEGVGRVGKTYIDLTHTALEMGFDAAVGALTGGGGLPVMFVRVFGQASQEANRRGASVDEQVFYGMTRAGIEVLTEKLADFGGGLVYGKGFTGDFAKQLIHNLKLSPVWEEAMYMVADTVGEGLEEGAADLMGGLAEMIIARNKDLPWWQDFKNKTAEECANIWTDMLLGSLMGLLGAGGGAVTGQYNAELAEQYNADVARDEARHGAIEDERDLRTGLARRALGENADTTRIDAMMDAQVAEVMESQSRATKVAQKLQALKVKEAAGREIAPEELLTKEEASIAVASGWIDRADRAKYTIEGASPSVREKLAKAGGGVFSKIGKGSRTKGKNRHENVTNPLDENFQSAGYVMTEEGVKKFEEDNLLPEGTVRRAFQNTAFKAATGITPDEADARANAESFEGMLEAGAEPRPTGGDAASENYDQMTRDEIVGLWREHKLTDAQFGEIMKRNHGWTEDDVRNHLARAKQLGASATERKRDTLDVKGQPTEATEGTQAKPELPDTPETAKSESERILKEIAENDTHIEEDHRPKGKGDTLYVRSRNAKKISEIAYEQRKRKEKNLRMSRDAEFESYTDENGKQLTLFEAAAVEKAGGKVYRWRAIDKGVVDEMQRATPENPLIVGRNYKGEVTAFLYDGTNLKIVHALEDGKGGFTIKEGEPSPLPAGEFEQAAIYLSESLRPSKDGRVPYSRDSSYGKYFGLESTTSQDGDIIGENGKGGSLNGQSGQIQNIQPRRVGDPVQRGGREVQFFEPGREGENEHASGGVLPVPRFVGEHAKEITQHWENGANYATSLGGKVLAKDDVVKLPKAVQDAKNTIEKTFGVPVTYVSGMKGSAGFVVTASWEAGIFIDPTNPRFAESLPHELGHILWHKYGGSKSRRAVVTDAIIESGIDTNSRYLLLARALYAWGNRYIGISTDGWKGLTTNEQLNLLIANPRGGEIVEGLYEEISNIILSSDQKYLKDIDGEALHNALINKLAEANIITQQEFSEVKSAVESISKTAASAGETSAQNLSDITPKPISEFDERPGTFLYNVDDPSGSGEKTLADQLRNEKEELQRQLDELKASQPVPKPADPHPPGTVKESRSAENPGTRGEKQAAKERGRSLDERLNTGDGTFVSKANEQRTEAADSLTATDEGKTEQYNRLLAKEKGSWTDDDVVIAQKLMGDFLRGIRDYQLNRGTKIPRAGYRNLAERYQALSLRHTDEKSKAGQKLQARYMWSAREEILQRVTLTFLNFSKDGRFAGIYQPNAKNARIYTGIEAALDRVQAAVDANDAKALAQICKDISDIRGIKRMFGLAEGFVSKFENDILNNIAGQENAVQALETLAYGNINAICDDVQPYKKLNAAKTIRVMNLLSNVSTSVNNVLNNATNALTSTNPLSQALSMQASKAFENVIGKPVLTKAGNVFNAKDEIHNAAVEALRMATLVQMYGINTEDGRLEISGDKGLFNPNANWFERTNALYKFFIGMGVEATDQVKAAKLQKAFDVGIDKAIASGRVTEQQAEEMRREAANEVKRLLYKDDNAVSNFVQSARNALNKIHVGNERTGTIGAGDIIMTFAKIPTNVVKTRFYMTPEGCLLQLAQYTYGVHKAKRMHSETLARGIMEKYATEKANLNKALDDAHELDLKTISYEEKQRRIAEIRAKINALDTKCWNEAREQCSGSVYRNLVKERDNHAEGLDFESAVRRCGYSDATEMSQFEAARYSRKIGKAATSAGMVALGAALRALGALKDFDQEPNEDLRKMYRQKGYSGLMLNWSAIGRKDHEWRDGDVILNADFLETVAMPLAIGAMAQEAYAQAGKEEGAGFLKKAGAFGKQAVWDGVGKTFDAIGDIPGMADAINLYNAVTSEFNTDNRAKGLRVLNAGADYLATTLPTFLMPNAVSQFSAGFDNIVRDPRSTDNMLKRAGYLMAEKVPFIRKKVPTSVDMWGDERTYGENKLWGIVNKTLLPGDIFRYKENKYESEIIRLVNAGYKGATPKMTVNGSFEVGGETFELDSEEKRAFKIRRNTAQAEAYMKLIDSKEYALLTDDQKIAVIKDLKLDCERAAKQAMLLDRGLDTQITMDKWETDLKSVSEQIKYLSMKQMAKTAWDSETNSVADPAAMDNFVRNYYGGMTQEMKDILDNSLSHIDDIAEAAKAGIGSEMWQKAYDIYKYYSSDEGKDAVEGSYKDWEATEMYVKIEKATGANAKQMKFFEDELTLWRSQPVNPEHYGDLVEKLGWTRESASALTKTMSELQPSNGNKNVSYKQRLRAIAEAPNVSDDLKWEAFYEYCPASYTKIRSNMTTLRKKGYTLEKALKACKTTKKYTLWWVYEGE